MKLKERQLVFKVIEDTFFAAGALLTVACITSFLILFLSTPPEVIGSVLLSWISENQRLKLAIFLASLILIVISSVAFVVCRVLIRKKYVEILENSTLSRDS